MHPQLTRAPTILLRVKPIKQQSTDYLGIARRNLAERVSVAGLQEALQEKIPWIRRCYQFTFIILTASCTYYLWSLFDSWSRSGYRDDIHDIPSADSLPFSNVTICTEVYLNVTFIEQNLTIPSHLADQFTKKTGLPIEELLQQLSFFLPPVSRPLKFTPTMLKYFSKILAANQHVYDLSAFLEAAYPQCQSMFKRCRFDGQEFDCCAYAVKSIDDAGACYIFALNHDSDNAHPSPSTFHQTKPGPEGGLSIEISLALAEFPWLDNEAENGYRVYVNAVPYGVMQSPLGAPAEAETFVQITPSKRLLSTNCAPHGHLHMKGGEYMYYDPEGFSCMSRAVGSIIHKYFSCYSPSYLYRPNSSEVCDPYLVYLAATGLRAESMEKELGSSQQASDSAEYKALMAKFIQEGEDDMKYAFSERSRCPNHCTYWTYSSTASFFYLKKPSAREPASDHLMYSRIHVYYGSLAYRQHEQVKAITNYLAFYAICNVLFLHWGMSVISFFHIAYYVPKYLYALGEMGRHRSESQVKKTRVVPIRKC